jgi:hypothetical protein
MEIRPEGQSAPTHRGTSESIALRPLSTIQLHCGAMATGIALAALIHLNCLDRDFGHAV